MTIEDRLDAIEGKRRELDAAAEGLMNQLVDKELQKELDMLPEWGATVLGAQFCYMGRHLVVMQQRENRNLYTIAYKHGCVVFAFVPAWEVQARILKTCLEIRRDERKKKFCKGCKYLGQPVTMPDETVVFCCVKPSGPDANGCEIRETVAEAKAKGYLTDDQTQEDETADDSDNTRHRTTQHTHWVRTLIESGVLSRVFAESLSPDAIDRLFPRVLPMDLRNPLVRFQYGHTEIPSEGITIINPDGSHSPLTEEDIRIVNEVQRQHPS